MLLFSVMASLGFRALDGDDHRYGTRDALKGSDLRCALGRAG